MSKITNEFSEFVLFSEDENRCLDERRIERDVRGKLLPYVRCLVRGKEVHLKPEERTRQLWLSRLIEQYGYPASRIQVEYPVTRSEEHTSELQSLMRISYAVFCLKKKKEIVIQTNAN